MEAARQVWHNYSLEEQKLIAEEAYRATVDTLKASEQENVHGFDQELEEAYKAIKEADLKAEQTGRRAKYANPTNSTLASAGLTKKRA